MNFTFRLFVFVTSVAAVLCTPTTDVQTQLNCPEEVWGDLGQDVTLTCSLKPPQDLTGGPHEWKFNGSKLVLVYRSQHFSPNDQDEQFMGRATNSSFCNLSEGRLSVRLSKLTTDDSGTYSCHVRIGENQPSCRTELRIGDTDSNDKNTGDPTAVTAGVSVGIIIGILAVIGVTAYCIWRRRRNCERQERPERQRKNDDGTSAGREATPLNRLGNDDSSHDTSG